MRLMKRNQTTIYYCLYKGKEPLLDEDGNETSEYRVLYERPVKLMCSVSHATGYAQVNMFGNIRWTYGIRKRRCNCSLFIFFLEKI